MSAIRELFQQYGPAYEARYGADMPAVQRRVMHAIQQCRTGQLGYTAYRCDGCATHHRMGLSCGNRHCPGCQSQKTEHWLTRQLERRLPCEYFLLTFTVPPALRGWIRSHPRVAYGAMFRAAAAGLKKLAADPKYVGTSQLGFTAVLHTWGRTVGYHPHLHLIVPAGGPSEDGQRWCPARANFLVPVKALSKLWRAMLHAELKAAGMADDIDPAVWRTPWVVHAKAVGDGEGCLKYLSRYVFRVAISNHRIESCVDGQVTFRYRKPDSRRWRRMTLTAFEFIRRFLQHVLPSRFMKVRHYGFLSANSKLSLPAVRRLVLRWRYGRLAEVAVWFAPPASTAPGSEATCPNCGQPMRRVAIVLPDVTRAWEPADTLGRAKMLVDSG